MQVKICLFAEFPNVAGVMDCTHVPIKAPKGNRDQFKDKYGNFSLNVQAIVNHRGALTNLVSRWPGSMHDTRILRESDMQQVLDLHLMGKYYLLGDQGYKCQSNLLTPYPTKESEKKEHYNISLSKTMVKVVCIFGQMKRKFACLSKRPDLSVEMMVQVVKACGFLWNFGLICGDNVGYNPDDYIVTDEENLNSKINASEGGKLVHDIVCDYLWVHK